MLQKLLLITVIFASVARVILAAAHEEKLFESYLTEVFRLPALCSLIPSDAKVVAGDWSDCLYEIKGLEALVRFMKDPSTTVQDVKSAFQVVPAFDHLWNSLAYYLNGGFVRRRPSQPENLASPDLRAVLCTRQEDMPTSLHMSAAVQQSPYFLPVMLQSSYRVSLQLPQSFSYPASPHVEITYVLVDMPGLVRPNHEYTRDTFFAGLYIRQDYKNWNEAKNDADRKCLVDPDENTAQFTRENVWTALLFLTHPAVKKVVPRSNSLMSNEFCWELQNLYDSSPEDYKNFFENGFQYSNSDFVNHKEIYGQPFEKVWRELAQNLGYPYNLRQYFDLPWLEQHAGGRSGETQGFFVHSEEKSQTFPPAVNPRVPFTNRAEPYRLVFSMPNAAALTSCEGTRPLAFFVKASVISAMDRKEQDAYCDLFNQVPHVPDFISNPFAEAKRAEQKLEMKGTTVQPAVNHQNSTVPVLAQLAVKQEMIGPMNDLQQTSTLTSAQSQPQTLIHPIKRNKQTRKNNRVDEEVEHVGNTDVEDKDNGDDDNGAPHINIYLKWGLIISVFLIVLILGVFVCIKFFTQNKSSQHDANKEATP